MRVVGDGEYASAEHGDTAVDPAGSVAGQTLGAWTTEMPGLPSSSGIEREDFVDRRDVHDAVDDDGGDLQRAWSARDREHPFGREVLNVAAVDLIERAEAIPALVAIVGRPRAGFRMDDLFERKRRRLGVRDRRLRDAKRKGGKDDGRGLCACRP